MEKRRQPEIIAGRVNADGSIATGDGFTVQKTGTGVYVLAFAQGFRLVSITPVISGGPGYAQWNGALTIGTYNTGAAATDTTFAFIAVGVQQ